MTTLLTSGVVSATVLLLAALGGIIAERSGVFSIALEGYMLCGAFAGVAVSADAGRWAGLAVRKPGEERRRPGVGAEVVTAGHNTLEVATCRS